KSKPRFDDVHIVKPGVRDATIGVIFKDNYKVRSKNKNFESLNRMGINNLNTIMKDYDFTTNSLGNDAEEERYSKWERDAEESYETDIPNLLSVHFINVKNADIQKVVNKLRSLPFVLSA